MMELGVGLSAPDTEWDIINIRQNRSYHIYHSYPFRSKRFFFCRLDRVLWVRYSLLEFPRYSETDAYFDVKLPVISSFNFTFPKEVSEIFVDILLEKKCVVLKACQPILYPKTKSKGNLIPGGA